MAYTYRHRTSARAEAKRRGEKTYDSGVMCKCGHGSVRLTSSTTCIICSRMKNERYRNSPSRQKKARQRTREWQKSNKAAVNAASRMRKAARRQVIARFFKDEIDKIYALVGPDEHVDHVVPLQHPLVCGLHVPWNLQRLPAKLNLTKGNSFDPSSYQGELARV